MNKQEKLKEGIRIRDESITREREKEAIILANLGQSVVRSKLGNMDALEQYNKAVSGNDTEIRDLEDVLRRLLADDEKRRAVTEEMKSLKVELRNIRNKEVPLFEDLGKNVWELWKSGKNLHEDIEVALDDLIKAESKLHAVDDAVIRSEQETRTKARNFFAKGKFLFFSGWRKTASSSLDRLWNRAGENLFTMISLESIADTPATIPFSSLTTLRKRENEITDCMSAIKDEIIALDDALNTMPGKGSLKKRVIWIEANLEHKRDALDHAFQELGEAWIDLPAVESSDVTVEKWEKEWAAVSQRIRDMENEQNTISSHLLFRESKERRETKSRQVSRLEEEIKRRQTVLKGLKKELSAIDSELLHQEENLSPLPDDC